MRIIPGIRYAVCVFSSMLACAAFAQPQATKIVHDFTYKIEEAEGATVLDDVYPFTLTVTHRGSTRSVAPLRLYVTGETARYFKSVDCMRPSFTLGDGDSVELACVMNAEAGRSRWIRALARTKTYPLLTEPSLASGSDGEVVKSPIAHVRINAGLLPICLGGFAGALLFVLFRMASTFLAISSDRACGGEGAFTAALKAIPTAAWCFCRHIVEAVVFALRGLLVAMIFILLAQALGTSNLPLTVRVEDFWGGVIVGLFSLPLSTWLASKLQLPLSTSASQKGQGNSAPNPAPVLGK